jgi:hypothetical protein
MKKYDKFFDTNRDIYFACKHLDDVVEKGLLTPKEKGELVNNVLEILKKMCNKV